jgi:hypothetical protein
MNGLLSILVAAAVAVGAHLAGGVPLGWAILVALPIGAGVFVAGAVSGVFDVDWTPEPDPRAVGTCLHASTLTDRLGLAAADPYRFTSRVQPRLRRLALDQLRRHGVDDLRDPRARELLGADLHDLLTARTAHLPQPATFTAMMRRLGDT